MVVSKEILSLEMLTGRPICTSAGACELGYALRHHQVSTVDTFKKINGVAITLLMVLGTFSNLLHLSSMSTSPPNFYAKQIRTLLCISW